MGLFLPFGGGREASCSSAKMEGVLWLIHLLNILEVLCEFGWVPLFACPSWFDEKFQEGRSLSVGGDRMYCSGWCPCLMIQYVIGLAQVNFCSSCLLLFCKRNDSSCGRWRGWVCHILQILFYFLFLFRGASIWNGTRLTKSCQPFGIAFMISTKCIPSTAILARLQSPNLAGALPMPLISRHEEQSSHHYLTSL